MCYTCVTSGEVQEFEDAVDRIEVDVVTAFLCAGHDVEDTKVCEEIADHEGCGQAQNKQ